MLRGWVIAAMMLCAGAGYAHGQHSLAVSATVLEEVVFPTPTAMDLAAYATGSLSAGVLPGPVARGGSAAPSRLLPAEWQGSTGAPAGPSGRIWQHAGETFRLERGAAAGEGRVLLRPMTGSAARTGAEPLQDGDEVVVVRILASNS